ncbi:MAG: RHS repeat-associated core domain-containing protein [Marinicella pacifica]
MLKRFFALIILNFCITLNSKAIVVVDDTLRLQIAQQVINEKGFYDATEVEKRARLHLLDQPVPDVGGTLVDSGSCYVGCDPNSNRVSHGWPMPMVTAIQGPEIKGFHLPNVRVKFKSVASELSVNERESLIRYEIFLSKNSATYEHYEVDLHRARDGDLPGKQFLRIKNLDPGNYNVYFRSVYLDGGVEKFSDFSLPESFSVVSFDDTVDDILNATLKTCVLSNGYQSSDLIKEIERLDCSNSGLTNDSLDELKNKFIGVRYLSLANNSGLTAWGQLGPMVQLSWLDLSDNPQMGIASALYAGDFDSIILQNMNLSSVKGVPYNATYVDLSHNNITASFTELNYQARDWPIAALNLSDNQIIPSDSASDFTTEISGQYIDAIDLSHSGIKDVADLSGINGLKHVNINNAAELNGTQDITNFAGLCGFSMNNTEVRQFRGIKPIQFVSLTNNDSLDRAQTLNSGLYWPMRVDLSGSNALKCGNYYNFIDATTPPLVPLLNDMSVAGDPSNFPACPEINWQAVFNHADTCKPNKINHVKVREDTATSRRFLTWTAYSPEQYDQWGVTHHKITSLVNDEVINIQYLNVSEGSIFIDNDLEPDSYVVQACTAEICGYDGGKDSAPFAQGLTSVSNVEQVWHADGNLVYFKFGYDNQIFLDSSNFGAPEFFEISPTFAQPDEVPEIVNIDVNGYQAIWETDWIDTDEYIGSHYKIKACRNDIGCGAPVTITLNPPIASPTIGELQNVSVTGSETTITLSWDLPTEGQDLIDYIKVIETQPLLAVNHRATPDVPSVNPDEQVITYYTDNLYQSLTLKRVTKGHYSFKVLACHRDREVGDFCSVEAVTVNKTLNRTEVNANLNDYLTGNEISIYHSNVDRFFCDNQPPGAVGNQGCFTPANYNVFYGISFGARGNGWARPDYYHIEKHNFYNQHGSYCYTKTKSETPGKIVDYIPLEDFTIRAKSLIRTALSSYCGINNPETAWRVAECFDGIGCGKQSLVRLPGGQISGYEETNNLVSAPVILDTESGIDQGAGGGRGGPGNLPPGSYWDPEQSGTGWQFHWATQLPGVDQSGTAHGLTYDLIGYWFAYKKFGQTDTWSPVWFKSKLKLNSAGNAYDGSLLYTRKVGNNFIEEEAGNLVVHLSPNSNNRYNLLLDLDFNDAELTTMIGDNRANTPCEITQPTGDSIGKCRFTLQDFNILIAGQTVPPDEPAGRFGYGNNADHYSGVWSYKDTGQSESAVTLITSIHRRMELTWVAFFDETPEGHPLWAIGSTCDGTSCTSYPNDTHLEGYKPTIDDKNIYTVPSGFNPLELTPPGFWHESTAVMVGRLGRCFKRNDDFDLGKFFLDVDTENTHGYLSYYRTTDLQIGLEGAATDGDVCDHNNTSGMAHLDRVAGFSKIRFTVNEENNPNADNQNYNGIAECDPSADGGLGFCDIRFDWYTDGFFENIKPFYSTDGGQNFQSLIDSSLCNNTLPNASGFLVQDFSCEISGQQTNVNYEFELRKLSYLPGLDPSDPSNWITIAKGEPLKVLACIEGSSNCVIPPSYKVTYFHTDIMGSIAAATDENGEVLWRQAYDAYGGKLNAPTTDNTQWFTGKEHDDTFNISYFGSRYYDPVIGRFLSIDPQGFKEDFAQHTFNRYAYAANNPYRYKDPDGEFFNFIVGAVKGAIEGVAIQSLEIGLGLRDSYSYKDLAIDAGLSAATSGLSSIKNIAKLKKLEDLSIQRQLKRCCFVAGTQVETKDGLKNIEDVKLGELLWAKNIETGVSDWKPVTKVFIEPDRQIYEIILQKPDKEIIKLEATDDHPFYVLDYGWKDTVELNEDDLIESKELGFVRVVSVVDQNRTDITYNFTIDEFNTYYVTEYGVLVHNCDDIYKSSGSPSLKDDAYHPNSVAQRRAKNEKHYNAFNPKGKAHELGFDRRIAPQRAPFDSHGQPVFFNGKNYITPDVDAHNVTNGWKMFDKKGRRTGTWNTDLTILIKG